MHRLGQPTVKATTDIASTSTPSGPGRTNSYAQILKSSGTIGGAWMITLALGAIRSKVMAVFLGPAGIGLMGMYLMITNTAVALASAGLGNSAVRKVAEVAATANQEETARTITALRRILLAFGATGMILLSVLSKPISLLTFRTSEHASSIVALSTTVLFGCISTGQTAIIQGLRKLNDFARINILSAVAGTAIGIPIICWLGLHAIVPVLLLLSISTAAISWWYIRRIPVDSMRLTWTQTWNESSGTLKLGVAFLASAFSWSLVGYLIRVLTARSLGIEAAGHYQAAFTIAGVYGGFVIQSMSADFYPRLSATAHDHLFSNRLINQQLEIALLLAGPGILATMAFAPLVVHLLYASSFAPAANLLRWFALALLLRIAYWPLNLILLAKGRGSLYMGLEVAANLIHLALAFAAVRAFGLQGTGIAFVALYVINLTLGIIVARRLTGLRLDRTNLLLGACILSAAALLLALSYILRVGLLACVGTFATLGMGLFTLRQFGMRGLFNGGRFSLIARVLRYLRLYEF